ncbi:MAG: hypothetical protein OXH24_09330 [Cyanobacteria bacterium MAG IRC3_bin_20]|nr:hypothetical protein [Cyanobacteria bacterium MAG IRC3_bin_20]
MREAAGNIIRRCLLEELPGIPVRTIRAGNSGTCCQGNNTRCQQRQDSTGPAPGAAVMGKGFA